MAILRDGDGKPSIRRCGADLGGSIFVEQQKFRPGLRLSFWIENAALNLNRLRSGALC
jgi:hypothetical protein